MFVVCVLDDTGTATHNRTFLTTMDRELVVRRSRPVRLRHRQSVRWHATGWELLALNAQSQFRDVLTERSTPAVSTHVLPTRGCAVVARAVALAGADAGGEVRAFA